MEETKGVIYILTNPSFPDYVKIGYTNDIAERLKQLNRSECTPFAFRVYATYGVSKELGDMKIHNIIDKLNPNLRAIDTVESKKRKREFYAMSAEDAYQLLEAIAEINGMEDNLKKWFMSPKEEAEEKEALTIRQEAFSFSMCNIEPNTELEYINDTNIKCIVISNKKVLYKDQEYSLSALAKELLGVAYGVAGPHYFLYNGKRLCDIREELEQQDH